MPLVLQMRLLLEIQFHPKSQHHHSEHMLIVGYIFQTHLLNPP
jgi:hypothetical protein